MMTDAEVFAALGGDTPLNRARREFSSACGRIEQAGQQRISINPIELRRMEFEAVEKIVAAYAETPKTQKDEMPPGYICGVDAANNGALRTTNPYSGSESNQRDEWNRGWDWATLPIREESLRLVDAPGGGRIFALSYLRGKLHLPLKDAVTWFDAIIASPTSYQQRVVAEKRELDEKLINLVQFISTSPVFAGLNPAEQNLLREQRDAMMRYSEALEARNEMFS